MGKVWTGDLYTESLRLARHGGVMQMMHVFWARSHTGPTSCIYPIPGAQAERR